MWFRNKDGVKYKINDEPVETYFTIREIHDKRLQYPHDDCIMLFGYKSSEVLEMIEECKRNKFKMTREEARQKIIQFKYNPEFLNMLEALELLKFEEEFDNRSPSTIIHDTINRELVRSIDYIIIDKCIDALVRAGYKVTEKKYGQS